MMGDDRWSGGAPAEMEAMGAASGLEGRKRPVFCCATDRI